MVDTLSISRGSGLASLGLGGLMTAMPGRMSRLFGLGGYRRLILVLGVRDLIIGGGLLSGRSARLWLRARAASDAADTAIMVVGLSSGAVPPTKAILGMATAIASSTFSFWLARRLS